jgi:hypothetical protein
VYSPRIFERRSTEMLCHVIGTPAMKETVSLFFAGDWDACDGISDGDNDQTVTAIRRFFNMGSLAP